jgi:hypothetical protein
MLVKPTRFAPTAGLLALCMSAGISSAQTVDPSAAVSKKDVIAALSQCTTASGTKGVSACVKKYLASLSPGPVSTTPAGNAAIYKSAFDKARTLIAKEQGIAFDVAGKPTPPVNDPCKQRLFVRADPLDNFYYGVNAGNGNAKGASISYTNSSATLPTQQTATINGIVSYVITDSACIDSPQPLTEYVSGYAIAPWISANGSWNNPIKKGEQSAASVGIDGQLEVSYGSLFDRQYFSASPYAQTDFRSEARITGATLSWEPIQHQIFLGQGRPVNDFFGGFWQFRAQADLMNVAVPGETNLTKGNHEWYGATARGNLFLFPLANEHSWPDWLLNRFSVVATAEYYYDNATGRNIQYYTAALQYQLTAPTAAGSSSISFEWDRGTDIATMIFLNQYLVKLSYKL